MDSIAEGFAFLALFGAVAVFLLVERRIEESLGDDDYASQSADRKVASPDATTVRMKLPRSKRGAA